MKKFYFPVLISVLFVAGCQKNEIPDPQNADTLFPKPYLPLYPGSWWEYRNVNDSSTFTKTAGPYVLAYAHYGNYTSKYFYTTTWDNDTLFGYGANLGYPGMFSVLLKEEISEKWQYGIDYGGYPSHGGASSINREVDSVGLTKIIGTDTFQNVIRVDEWSLGGGYYAGFYCYYYFAKDVGLIEKGRGSTKYYQIENYFINH